MRIGIVGGIERSESEYRKVAERRGHELEYHPGHMAGRGSAGLAALVDRCDRLLIVTDVNSHRAVDAAKRAARARGIEVQIVRHVGVRRFDAWLSELAA